MYLFHYLLLKKMRSVPSYLLLVLLIGGCSINHDAHITSTRVKHNIPPSNKYNYYRALSRADPNNFMYKGHYKIGKKYKIKNVTYVPTRCTKYVKYGIASWYGEKDGFHGKKTANGEIYNKNVLSAAHPTLPLPSLVKVTNLNNNRSIILYINDRGPFHKGRIIDVSEAASKALGFHNYGTAKVKVEYLHNESKKFLDIIGLSTKTGSTAAHKVKIPGCSVNCYIKLLNAKYGLK